MWLPTRVYEILPAIYIIVGQIFMAGSVYISSYHKLAPVYFAFGVLSVVSGLFVNQRRLYKRRIKQLAQDYYQA